MLHRVRELRGGVCSGHQFPSNLRRNLQQLLAIPAEMFARDPDSALFTVEEVQRVEMSENNITRLGAQKWR